MLEIAATRAGFGNRQALRKALVEALLVVPVTGEQRDLLTADHSGVSWLLAFTSMRELALYGRAQGDGDRQWDYLTCRGSHLRNFVSGALLGIAVDVAGRGSIR